VSANSNRFSYAVKEDEDAVFADITLTRSLEEKRGEERTNVYSNSGSKRGSRFMSCPSPSHVTTPTIDYTHPEIEVELCTTDSSSGKGSSSDNGPSIFPSSSFEETDFAFDPLREDESHDDHVTEDQRVCVTSEDDLDLSDISFAFKRRSLSFESLLDAFKGDRKFQHLFRDSAHMSSLQSLADSSDDESDQETESTPQVNKDTSLLDSSMQLESSFSDIDTSSLGHSYNTSQLSDLRDSGVSEGSYPLPDDLLAKSLSYDNGTSHDIVGVTSGSTKLPRRFPDDTCPIPVNRDSCPQASADMDTCSLPNVHQDACPADAAVGDAGALERFDRFRGKLTQQMKRSKSQDSASRNAAQRKAAKAKSNGVPQFLRKTKQVPSPAPCNDETTPTLSTTPADMLIQFQIASMGCVMGVESRVELRAVVKDSATNSENDNYTISQERE
jgi:hypothetical protein